MVCIDVQTECLRANLTHSSVRLFGGDALKLDYAPFREQAVVFGDPPYERAEALWRDLAPRLAPSLAPDGVLVWETDQRTALEAPAALRLVDSRRYGAARFHFFQVG